MFLVRTQAELLYKDYKAIISLIREQISFLREKYALEKYGKSKRLLNKNIQDQIEKIFPEVIFDELIE